MTAQEIIEKIRAEVERRKEQAKKNYDNAYSIGRCDAFSEMLNFINILESENPTTAEGLEEEENIFANKDLNKEWKKFIEQEKKENHGDLPCYGDFGVLRLARHFAQWGAEHLKK